jgi:hypothetical protein
MSDKTGGDLATPLEELVEIGGMLDAMIAAPRREVADPSERYRYGFLEGRAFELTAGLTPAGVTSARRSEPPPKPEVCRPGLPHGRV